MPPKHPKHHQPPHSRRASLSFIDRDEVDSILAPLLPDKKDRALVVRCLLEEGPAHHRGVNYILIKLMSLVAGELAPTGNGLPVPMRLPPHVDAHTDSVYALRLPLSPLEKLAQPGSAESDAMIDCLLDGPPQHYLANVVMLCAIEKLLSRGRGE